MPSSDIVFFSDTDISVVLFSKTLRKFKLLSFWRTFKAKIGDIINKWSIYMLLLRQALSSSTLQSSSNAKILSNYVRGNSSLAIKYAVSNFLLGSITFSFILAKSLYWLLITNSSRNVSFQLICNNVSWRLYVRLLCDQLHWSRGNLLIQ